MAAIRRATRKFRFLCLLLAASAGVQAAEPNYQLEISAPDEIASSLRTRTLLGRWQAEPGFEPAQMPLFIERGREEAESIAQAAGYFSAQVTVGDRVGPDGVTVVRMEVDAGARTTVGRMTLTVRGADESILRAADDAWPLPDGSFFRTDTWELGKRQLLELLQQRGHLRAAILDSRAEVDPELTAASLSVIVDAGPRLVFGPLVVRGLERYPRSMVDALRPFREGDPYTFERLLQFQERLRGDGWFASVSVVPDLAAIEADPAATAVPVIVELGERQAQRFSVGAGFSTDQGPRGLFGYENRNLFGRGWVLESGVLAESVRHRLYASVRTPWDETAHRWQGGVRGERLDVSGELTDKNTLYLGRGWRGDETETFLSLQYQTERSAIDIGADLWTDHKQALTLGYAWSLRRLDSRIDPRDGYTVSTQLSGALRGLGTDRSFGRFYGRAMRFVPMPRGSALEGGLLVGLLEAGMVVTDSRAGIPSENLFRAGGAQSLRGYSYLGLGVAEGNAIVGGRVLAIGSLEYQHPVADHVYGAVFVDVGNAADTWAAWKPVVGSGVGLRWRSPIGPVNVDAAYGDADRRWRLHFSVGYTF